MEAEAGLVGIIANDSARYSLFAQCVTKMIPALPPGSRVEWLIGGDWCGARNTLAEMVLASDAGWLWFMDDDHAFPPSMLPRLLSYEVPLVVPICLTRVYPFAPVTYTEKVLEAEKVYLPIPLSQQPADGLVDLEAGGCAGMLIRRDVLEAVEPPWFEYTDRSEDIVFCEKAAAAGFQLRGDLGSRLGHITTAVVHPEVRDGRWVTVFTIGRDLNLFVETADLLIREESDGES